MTSSRITRIALAAIVAWCLTLILVPAASAQTILRVDIDSTATNPDGSTWEDAFKYLQDALFEAQELLDDPQNPPVFVQIWVAEGTYLPTQADVATLPSVSDDREHTFNLIPHVEIYGGFFGDETDIGQRDPETYITILSGDLDDDDQFSASYNQAGELAGLTFTNYDDNSYHVVTAVDADATGVINGVMIHGPVMIRSGSPRLLDCTFRADRGHGWNRGVDAASAMVHCGDDAAPALVRPRYVEPGARSALTR